MRAEEILALAVVGRHSAGVSVLDLCCGVAGPGRFITGSSVAPIWGWTPAPAPSASRVRAPAAFPVASWSRGSLRSLPARSTWCSCSRRCSPFRTRRRCCRRYPQALTTGGRFAFTMEEGLPLTEAERERMPDADTVWLTPLQEMLACLERVGLLVRWQDDCTASHGAVADSLIDAFEADAPAIAAQIGRRALEELLAAHRLWSNWLREGRVRKFAFVAEKTETPHTGPTWQFVTATRRGRSPLRNARGRARPAPRSGCSRRWWRRRRPCSPGCRVTATKTGQHVPDVRQALVLPRVPNGPRAAGACSMSNDVAVSRLSAPLQLAGLVQSAWQWTIQWSVGTPALASLFRSRSTSRRPFRSGSRARRRRTPADSRRRATRRLVDLDRHRPRESVRRWTLRRRSRPPR